MLATFPDSLYQRLEFDRILELLGQEALGEKGLAVLSDLPVHTDLATVSLLLQESGEYLATLREGNTVPMGPYGNLDDILRMLVIEDYVLSTGDFVLVRQVLVTAFEAARFLAARQQQYPVLASIAHTITLQDSLLTAINRVFDAKGELRPDASPDLMRIRKQIQSRSADLEAQFRKLMLQFKAQGLLSEQGESIRNGRKVLSVPAENKRRIGGIVHDESATGKTVFIEPEAIVQLNNDLFDLHAEERREIYRIMQQLSGVFRPFAADLGSYEHFLARLDIIRSKALLANALHGEVPELVEGPHFGLQKAYHPLLLLRNLSLDRKTVPFDLTLHHGNRILLLSGPNAGGKSITMKAVGLLQLMLQSGIPIPVGKQTRMGIFEQLFADIGDQQSLEEDLSTYSSHLRNMKHFTEQANARTLVLIDEFGVGTDPQIGGAIAEGVLKKLNEIGVYGVINTHYSNLKIFAHKTKGIVNGSMFFDKENLQPTYEMKVGAPGSSFAFEIARQVGLDQQVLRHARHKTGKNERAIDELLVELQQEKILLDDKLLGIIDKEKSLERLVRNYEHMQREFEVKRKKLRLDIKAQQSQKIQHDHKEIEKTLREIKETLNLEKAKALAESKRAEKEALEAEQAQIRQQMQQSREQNTRSGAPEIKPGSFVRMRNSGATGQVESIVRQNAIVSMGLMRMTLPLDELEAVGEQLEVNTQRRIQVDLVAANAAFDARLDLRGFRLEEAVREMEEFMDKALMTNSSSVRIVHGKGNGTLRRIVRQKLREIPGVSEIYHPAEDQGGDGVTIVKF